jgi:hypothetical protein
MDTVLVDLVAKVEDTFGFAIPEEDARELNTVGRLYEYVLTHRFHGKQQVCLSRIALHKIRRAMTAALHIPPVELRPSASMAAVLPRRRRHAWRVLEKATGLRLPQLRRPRWVCKSAAMVSLAVAIAMPILLSLGPFNGAILLAIVTAFAAGHCAYWLTVPFAYQLQPDCTTLDQLATATLARNFRPLVEESSKSISDTEVWKLLQTIAAAQLGVRPADIAQQTSFSGNLQAA